MNASKLFVPGMGRCGQCDFTLTLEKMEPLLWRCPVHGFDLRAVTWEDHANRSIEELNARLIERQESCVACNVVRDSRDLLQQELNYVYELEPDLKREGLENFEGYFCHWNKIIHWAAKQGVSGYAQDPMELLATLVNQRDEAREGLQAKLLAVAEKCFIAGHETAMGEEANYDSALKRWMESLVKMDLETECQQAPPGWQCTRETGHDGPCAAVESGVV